MKSINHTLIQALMILLGLAAATTGFGEDIDAESWYQQAEEHYRGQSGDTDLGQAVELYTRAAESGHAKAQNMLAYLYESGEGVDKDPVRAFAWYLKAAEGGYPTAQFNLAQRYYSGVGVEQDEKLAFEWCEKAARGGQKGAMVRLSEYYMKGIGTRKNYPKSYAWFQIAFEAGAFAPMGMKHTLVTRMDYMQSIEAENQTRKLREELYGSNQ